MVSGGVPAGRGDEDDDDDQAGQGEERMNDGEGRRVGVVVGEGVGVASRKASAVGDVDEEGEDAADESVVLVSACAGMGGYRSDVAYFACPLHNRIMLE